MFKKKFADNFWIYFKYTSFGYVLACRQCETRGLLAEVSWRTDQKLNSELRIGFLCACSLLLSVYFAISYCRKCSCKPDDEAAAKGTDGQDAAEEMAGQEERVRLLHHIICVQFLTTHCCLHHSSQH